MRKARLSFGGIIVLAIPALIIFFFSTKPSFTYHPADLAEFTVSIKKTTRRVHLCTDEEKKAFESVAKTRRTHMQRASRICGSRERVPLDVKISIGGELALEETASPVGLNDDGVTFLHKHFPLKPGKHKVKVWIKDKAEGTTEHLLEQEVSFASREVVVVNYDKEHEKLQVRIPAAMERSPRSMLGGG